MPSALVRGRKVYYEIHGDAPGTPLLLLMGMGGSCRGWLPLQVPEFQQTRRTLLVDAPLSPLRTGRQPQTDDRKPLDDL